MSRITYSDAIANRILDALAHGRTLKDICREPGMPNKSRVFAWVEANRHGFGDRYNNVRHVRGRGSCYSRALAERICAGLRAGRTLLDVCDDDGMPSVRVVRQWVTDDRDGFRARYWQARGVGYMAIADEIIEIADKPAGESVARSRLRITARRWTLSKMLPRAFGARPGVDTAPEADASLRMVIALINCDPDLSSPNVDGRLASGVECLAQDPAAPIWPAHTCRNTCIGPEIDCNLVP